jgi:hypothetical protein
MERQTRETADVPKWSALLVEAVEQARPDHESVLEFSFLFAGQSIARTCAVSDARVAAWTN